jgi:hypothetical protein
MAETLEDVKKDLYRAFTRAAARLEEIQPWDARFEGALHTVSRLGDSIVRLETKLSDRDSLIKTPKLPGGSV